MWIVLWDQFLMKKWLKSDICGFDALFTVENSTFKATVQEQ